MHEGKTWHVCCQGCRQAFENDPGGIIADYLVRKKQNAMTGLSRDNTNPQRRPDSHRATDFLTHQSMPKL